jgi:putative membrane protein
MEAEMRCLLASISLVVVLASPVFAQTAPAAKRELSQQDRSFVTQATTGGLAEVAAGKIAEEKAQKDNVKDFARQMVTDHSKANDQLATIAQQEKIKAPTAPDKRHAAAADRLKKMSGAEFDRSYMKGQIEDHEKTVQLFQKEAKSGQDPKLKAFAADTLPVLQHHLQMAQGIGAK